MGKRKEKQVEIRAIVRQPRTFIVGLPQDASYYAVQLARAFSSGETRQAIVGTSLSNCFEIAFQKRAPVGKKAEIEMRKALDDAHYDVQIVTAEKFSALLHFHFLTENW